MNGIDLTFPLCYRFNFFNTFRVNQAYQELMGYQGDKVQEVEMEDQVQRFVFNFSSLCH